MSKTVHIDFYYSACDANYEYIEKLSMCKNVYLKEYLISPSRVNRFLGLINYFKMLRDIYLNKNKYCKIHFIWSVLFLFECLIFSLIKDKLIFTFHNDVPHSYKKKVYWPYKAIMKIAYKIVFVSNYTMTTFIQNYGKHPNYQLVQHGIMPIETLSNTHLIANAEVEKNIVFWGRVEEYKGVDIFDDYNLDYPVEIYGKWSSQLVSLKKKLNLKDGVYITDSYLPFDELATMFTREIVFILPYKAATQSGVLYTFLAYGKVFISSDVGENNDFLIQHGLEKLIFVRGNEESLKHAINYAFNNYNKIKAKLFKIKEIYEWKYILNISKIDKLYELSADSK